MRWILLVVALAGCGGEPIEGSWTDKKGLTFSIDSCGDDGCSGSGEYAPGRCDIRVSVDVSHRVVNSGRLGDDGTEVTSYQLTLEDADAPTDVVTGREPCWSWGPSKSCRPRDADDDGPERLACVCQSSELGRLPCTFYRP